LIERARPIESIALIVRGNVRISNQERVLGTLRPPDIVGSALLMSGVASDVEAVTVEPTRLIRWEVEGLERYLDANPETRNVFQRHLARDLAGKLRQVTAGLATSAIHDTSSGHDDGR
jgi:CRP-like cAMP-binding protein